MKPVRYAACLLAALAPAAFAQVLSGVKVEPAQARVGEAVKITVDFEVQAGINCGLRVDFGDGSQMDYKINQNKDVPLVINRSYAKAGSYEIKAEPRRNQMTLACAGNARTANVAVAAAAPAAAKPAAKTEAKPAAPACPGGWTLDAKSVKSKTGAYTCRAKPGTPPPQSKLACPGDLGYFENAKKGQLGCQ